MEAFSLSFALVVTVVVIVFTQSCSVIIPEGQSAVVEFLGAFQSVITAGLHWVLPGFSTLKRVNWTYTEESPRGIVTKQKRDYLIPYKKKVIFDPESVQCLTLDKIKVKVNLVITYQIVDVKKCVYEVEDLYRTLQSAVSSAAQQVVQELPIDTLLQHRGNIVAGVIERLASSNRWGIEIIQVDLQELDIPNTIIKAIEDTIALEKNLEAKKKSELANRELELCKRDTLLEIQLREQKATLERVQAEVEAEKIKTVGNAQIEAQKSSIQAKAEFERLALLFKDDPKRIGTYITDKMFAEALSNSKGKTLIIPHETSKFLGTTSTLSLLREIPNYHSSE